MARLVNATLLEALSESCERGLNPAPANFTILPGSSKELLWPLGSLASSAHGDSAITTGQVTNESMQGLGSLPVEAV